MAQITSCYRPLSQERLVESVMENYQAKFVAFVDILGFKELVLQSESDDRTFIQIMNSIYQPDRHRRGLIDIEISNFSDCFVFSCNSGLIEFGILINKINKLYMTMLEFGTLARGGISFGSMYHHDGMAFGPAFLDAYHLENTVARYPRVVLGKRAIDKLQSLAAQDLGEKATFLKNWLRRDEDGVVYVDQFAEFGPAFSDQDTDSQMLYKAKADMIGEHLSQRMSNALDTPAIFEKYKWITGEYNAMASKYKSLQNPLKIVNFYELNPNYVQIKRPSQR